VSIRNEMPAVPVRDLQVHQRDNDIIVATHGRGMYILDDATPLQRIADVAGTDVHLFDSRPATRWIVSNFDGDLGNRIWAGQNPPAGAMVTYYLKAASSTPLRLTISDASGRLIREIRTVPRDSGVNRATWDLRYEGPRQPATPPPDSDAQRRVATASPAAPDEEFTTRFGIGAGPFVMPGEYTATLTAGSKSLSTRIQVRADPRVEVTVADLRAQHDVALALRELTSRANAMLEQTDGMTRQLTSINQTLRPMNASAAGAGRNGDTASAVQQGAGGAAASALQAVTAAQARLKTFRDEKLARPLQGLGYRQYPRLREEIQTLGASVSRPQEKPTDAQSARLRELSDETVALEGELQAIIATEVARVNQLLSGTPHAVTPPARRITP
jgi:hypothetical protein